MRKFNSKTIAAILLCGAFMFSSCIGSFSLHNKLLNWNKGIGDRFVNELVYLACNIIPVYAVCYLADALVLNSIEFWSGKKSMADIGTVKNVKGENGNYAVTVTENGYNITKEGEKASLDLVFNSEDNTWTAVSDGVEAQIVKINDDGTATMTLADGTTMNVTQDAAGVDAFKTAIENSMK